MLDKFIIRNIFAPKKRLSTSKSIINTFIVPKSEKVTINKHTASLVLQSIGNFFTETGRISEFNQIPRQKKYRFIKSSDAMTLFPFLGNESQTGYSKTIVFGVYCDLLQYVINKNKSKEAISSVLNNIKILYFQNPSEIKSLLTLCEPVVESGLKYIDSDYGSANEYFSSFGEKNVPTDAATHMIYFKEMLTKQPFYKSRKFLAFGLAGLGLIGYFVNQGEDTTTNNLPSRGPIVDNIEYPRNTNISNKVQKQSQPIPKNGLLYKHHASGISILPVKNQEEYYKVSGQLKEGAGTYSTDNEYNSISRTVSDPALKIDRKTTKTQVYKIISLLRKNRNYTINDITYGLADEIRVEDLPEGVAGLFKNWSDNPTDKDIYLDTDLVNGGTQLEQERVLVHEFIHSLVGTSPSTLRNEGMTEALTHRSFYDSRHIDLFNFNDPYSPHVLDFIMIHNVYGSGYDGFEHFGLELVYNYEDLSTPVVNPEYASGLEHILSTNPKNVINPVVIAFFTGGLDGIDHAKKHFLCTPGTVKGFETVKNMYEKSEFYAIEQNNSLTDIEKIQRAIDYYEANKGNLSATSPHDELPGNEVNVDFNSSNKTGNGTSQGPNKERREDGDGELGGDGKGSGNGLGKQQDTGGDHEHQKPSSEKNSREGDISRGEFVRDLALDIVVAGADGRLGTYLDEARYPWYDGKIDPQYFRQQIKNIIKNRIEVEVTKNGNWELSKDEESIIENIVNKVFKTDIHALAQSFEREMKSEQTYNERVQNNLDFLDYHNPRGLQKTSERIVDDYLKNIDITGLILEQDNIYDIIHTIAKQDVLSKEFLRDYFSKEFNTYVHESNIEGNVPFFEEKYLSTDDAADVMAEQYGPLINATTHITYTFEENQSTIRRIKHIIKEKRIGIIDAVKIVLLEQNEGEISRQLKQSPFYQEAVHRYTDPLGEDQNLLLKHIYDILNFVDRNKLPISLATSGILLFILLSYVTSWKEKRDNTKHALRKKYISRINNKTTFPIHDYISKKEVQGTISSLDNKLWILNVVLFFAFLIGWSTTNMSSYKQSLLVKEVEQYMNENPRRKRTPHTYMNLLLSQDQTIKTTDKKIRIEKSYTEEDYSHLFGLQSGSFPFDPYLHYGTETTLPTQKAKEITRVYQVKGDNFSTPTITRTHQNIQTIIGTTSLENAEKNLSTRGLVGAILLTIGSLTSLLLLAYNTSKHLKKIESFRKKTGKLISLPGLHSINEREVDLLMTDNSNLNHLIWEEIEYHFSNLTNITEPDDVARLLSSVDMPGENYDTFPFTNKVKNISTYDREALGKIIYEHLGEEQIDKIKGYTHMIINYEQHKLFPGSSNSGTLALYKKNKKNLYNTVALNFIEYYLPRIILAKIKGRPIETYINRLPYSEKVAYFTNVKIIKQGLPVDEKYGEIQSNGFSIHSMMIPQVDTNSIKQPITGPSTLNIGW